MKKDLYFDPEFWNLITLRTNCLKLMSEKVVSAALEEIMEDKWILKYCTKDSSTPVRQKEASQVPYKKRNHKEDSDAASKRLKIGRPRLDSDHTGKKKGNQGSRHLIGAASKPLRRSFWQLDRLQDNGEARRTTRLSEKNPPKRRIRTPRWLLEDSGTLEENNARSRMRRHGLKHQKHHQSSVLRRSEVGQMKNNAKHKASMNSHLTAKENNSSKHQKGISLDSVKAANAPPQVILELSLPDNELMGTFNEETCNRHRGFPQVLLYKPTVKVPEEQQPAKTVLGKEVILRARDPAMFIQQLHCYARRQKGKGSGLNVQGSVSTITRSSAQGSPPKDLQGRLHEKPAAEIRGGVVTRTKAQPTKALPRKTSSVRELSGKAAVEMKSNASVTLADHKVTEAPMVDQILQGKTITSARGLCEGSAVEMKVTIASQTLTAAKESQPLGVDKVSKSHKARETSETTASSELSQTLTGEKKEIQAANECSKERVRILSQSEDVLSNTEGKLASPSSPAKTEKQSAAGAKSQAPEPLTNGISERDAANISPKLSKELESNAHSEALVTSQNKASPRDSLNDLSALTLVTEMVTKVAPEGVAQDLQGQKTPAPAVKDTKGSKAGGKPKVSTTCSGPLQEFKPPQVHFTQEDVDEEQTEDVNAPETEESRLEFSCTFCHKVFKGSRVVAHAMFHYRKDECMFCRMAFKDDLLAMMHLSDHIEKLKRLRDASCKNVKDGQPSESKDISESTNVPPERRRRGRPRKSSTCSQPMSPTDSAPSEPKRLRSSHKPEESPAVKEEKQNKSAPVCSQTPTHKVNGHIGPKKKLGRPRKIQSNPESEELPLRPKTSQDRARDGAEKEKGAGMNPATSPQGEKELRQTPGAKTKKTKSVVRKTATKPEKKKKHQEPQEKICCPVDGCAWFTDLSKSRVALLYHALEDHYGEEKPLKMAYRVGNGKCSCCMRVLWSFEHFLHHVERHRLTPRYPCPHQGCSVRFKTGIEMRRHARRHDPLQAACCLPDCSQLFICLWALNLHERDHYASSSSKSDSNELKGEKNNQTPAGKKQPEHKPKDAAAAAALDKTVSVKAASKLGRHNIHHRCKLKKRGRPPLRAIKASLSKQEVKETNETHKPQVLKNLSNEDQSERPSGSHCRSRHQVRKVTSLQPERAVSSSLFKHNLKVRHKQVTKVPKRRGRPPKIKSEVPNENETTAQKEELEKEKNVRSTRAAESQGVRNPDKSKCKMSISKSIKINHVKQKRIHRKTRFHRANATSATTKTQKEPVVKMKKTKKRQSLASEPTKSEKNEPGDCKSEIEEQESKSGVTQVKVLESPAEEEVKETQSSQSSFDYSKPPSSSVEEMHVIVEKGEEEKTTSTATTDLSRKQKEHKDAENKGENTAAEVGQLKRDEKKPAAEKRKPKSKPGSSLNEETQLKDEASNVTCTPSVPPATVNRSDETSSSPATEDKTQVVTMKKKSKTVDPNKAKRKREDAKEAGPKIVKKRSKDPSVPLPSKKPKLIKPKAQPVLEVKAEGGTSSEAPQTSAQTRGYSALTQERLEDPKAVEFKQNLAEYGKRPYTRAPPEVYLDEKYITMPKRRKETLGSPHRNPAPELENKQATAQRQRCANCFATFSNAEELQSHVQLRNCSELFGFDSDDEGESPSPHAGLYTFVFVILISNDCVFFVCVFSGNS